VVNIFSEREGLRVPLDLPHERTIWIVDAHRGDGKAFRCACRRTADCSLWNNLQWLRDRLRQPERGVDKDLRHQVREDTFTVNGRTRVGTPYAFDTEVLFDSSGNVTHIFGSGLVETIPLPDGSLFVSAGRLDFTQHPGVTFLLSPDMGTYTPVQLGKTQE